MKYKSFIAIIIAIMVFFVGCSQTSDIHEESELLLEGRVMKGSAKYSLDCIDDYPNLKELYISNMEIGGYEKLSNNNTITKLVLDNNKCFNLDPISTIPNLEIFVIYNSSGIEDFSCLTANKSLWYLAISDTTISKESGLFELDQLQQLIMDNTALKSISGIEKLQNLTTIHIVNNNVNDISSLSELHSVNRLFLYDNNISDITALKELSKLEFLSLERNNISDLSPIYELKSLKKVNLTGNPLTQEQVDDLQKALPNCKIVFESSSNSELPSAQK